MYIWKLSVHVQYSCLVSLQRQYILMVWTIGGLPLQYSIRMRTSYIPGLIWVMEESRNGMAFLWLVISFYKTRIASQIYFYIRVSGYIHMGDCFVQCSTVSDQECRQRDLEKTANTAYSTDTKYRWS